MKDKHPLDEVIDACETNMIADWDENDPTVEFRRIADMLITIRNNGTT